MADNRFPDPSGDDRFPDPSTDYVHPDPATDRRFPSPGVDTRFDGSPSWGSLDLSTFFAGASDGWLLEPTVDYLEEAASDPAESGDVILNWNVAAGTAMQFTEADVAERPLFTDGGVQFDGVDDALRSITPYSASADATFFCVVRRDGTDDAMLLCDNNSRFVGAMDTSTSAHSTNTTAGHSTLVDGVTLANNQRTTLRSAILGGSKHIVEITNLVFSAWSANQWLGRYNPNTSFSGAMTVWETLVLDAPSAQDRADIRTELASRHGITL